MMKRACLILMVVSLAPWAGWLWGEDAPPRGHPRRWGSTRHRRGFGQGKPLSKEQEAELLAVAAKKRPEFHKALLQKKEKDPRVYQWMLWKAWRWYKTPAQVRKAMIDRVDCRVKISRICVAMEDAKDDQARQGLIRKLTEQVGLRFDADQIVRKHESAGLEAQVERWAQELTRRAAERESLIQTRLQWYLSNQPGDEERRTPHAKPPPAGTDRAGEPHRGKGISHRSGFRGGPGYGHGDPGQLDPKRQKELLDWYKQRWPEEHKRLTAWKGTDSTHYRRQLQARWGFYERWKALPEVSRQALIRQYDSRVKIWQIRTALRDAKGDKVRKQLTDRLARQVARQFDADQVLLGHRLQQFRERITRFRQELAQRANRRDAIIKEQVAQYLAGPAPKLPSRRGSDDRPGAPAEDD